MTPEPVPSLTLPFPSTCLQACVHGHKAEDKDNILQEDEQMHPVSSRLVQSFHTNAGLDKQRADSIISVKERQIVTADTN